MDSGSSTGDASIADVVIRDVELADADSSPPGRLSPVFGVTVSDPWVAQSPGSELESRLAGLVGSGGRLPTVRVVFDEGVDQVFLTYGFDASAYMEPLSNLRPQARIMGELLDSFYVTDYEVDQYRARACEYRATLGHLVDIWEIGNEVNGEWLGPGLLDKLVAATQVLVAEGPAFETLCPGFVLQAAERPFELALTLYYNGTYNGGIPSADNCWSDPDHAMEHWVTQHFQSAGALGTESIAPHLDYVLVSYYEDGCEDLQPIWQDVFDQLGEVFGEAALGIGECGTRAANDKVHYVERYYHGMDSVDPALANMAVDHPRYVGGLFWWYFSEDLTNEPFYTALQQALDNPFWLAP